MKKIYILMCIIIFSALNAAADEAFFKSMPVKDIYNGKNILPNEYSKKEGIIFDSLGKAVDIQLNFNGRYSIVRHSCGMECSYITLIDLSNGSENSSIFSDYSLSEAGSIMINNEKYLSIPVSKADSYGIIMKYYPVTGSDDICYEQKMKIENGSLKILSDKVKAECPDF